VIKYSGLDAFNICLLFYLPPCPFSVSFKVIIAKQ